MSINYPGNELELFEKAENWKTYFTKVLKPFVSKNVVEVGAGIGGTTPFLVNENVTSWTCIEPDSNLYQTLKNQSEHWNYTFPFFFQNDVLSGKSGKKDSIIYIDVLEHIEDDQAEIEKAFSLLNPGGHLIILVPAFNWLFNEFDKSVGHFRRYDKNMMRQIIPKTSSIVKMEYLDSLGFFSSMVNKIFLKQPYPKKSQILFWDRILIPLSKIADFFTLNSFGKSLIVVLKK